MPYSLILHVLNAEPVIGEVDELPAQSDLMIKLMNPRRLDGKDLSSLLENVSAVYWPIERLNFIEVVSAAEEEELVGFVRE